MIDTDTELLKGIANQLRIHSIEATTAAGSGHPTSCCSAADLVATLFFGQMRYDAKNPHFYNNDRFILSKGHAAPLLYAAWAENGFVPIPELLTLRQFTSELFFFFTDTATTEIYTLSLHDALPICPTTPTVRSRPWDRCLQMGRLTPGK